MFPLGKQVHLVRLQEPARGRVAAPEMAPRGPGRL